MRCITAFLIYVLSSSVFASSDVGIPVENEEATEPNRTISSSMDKSEEQVKLITEKDIAMIASGDDRFSSIKFSNQEDVAALAKPSPDDATAPEEVVIVENTNVTLSENGTDVAVVNKTRNKVTCQPRNLTEDEVPAVKIVNSSVLLNIVVPSSNITANECALVMFYAPWCHFSALAAPHYNALARVFPSVHILAINALKYNSLNSRYGTVAVPTLLLFHNGRAVAKFNETQFVLDKYIKFMEKYTGVPPLGLANVTSADFDGPMPSEPTQETDYVLLLAWIFIVMCCVGGFAKSSVCNRMIETVRNNWREAEAQHEHAD